MEDSLKICMNCKFSCDSCCYKKKRKGILQCFLNVSNTSPLVEVNKNSSCLKWIIKDATGE